MAIELRTGQTYCEKGHSCLQFQFFKYISCGVWFKLAQAFLVTNDDVILLSRLFKFCIPNTQGCFVPSFIERLKILTREEVKRCGIGQMNLGYQLGDEKSSLELSTPLTKKPI